MVVCLCARKRTGDCRLVRIQCVVVVGGEGRIVSLLVRMDFSLSFVDSVGVIGRGKIARREVCMSTGALFSFGLVADVQVWGTSFEDDRLCCQMCEEAWIRSFVLTVVSLRFILFLVFWSVEGS